MEFLNKFDRQKLQRITLLVIAALTLIAMVLLLVIIIASVEGGSTPQNIDGPQFDNLDEISYEAADVTADMLNQGSLVLVNSNHSYIEPANLNLVNIAEYRNGLDTSIPYSVAQINLFHLERTAVSFAHNMLVQLKADTGNDKIYVSAAYGKGDYTKDIHTGYTMVLTVYGGTYLKDAENADLNNWLVSNAHKFGFVVRYPDGKEEITGVSEYSHAFRYVGIPHATYMKETDKCLEEYIEFLKKNTSHKDVLTIAGADGKAYAVYYTPVSANGGSILVPVQTPNPDGSTNFEYVISGTNEGGVIVTVSLD